MKVESKSALILLTTLVLGMLLGMVGQALLERTRVAQVGEMRRPRGFVSHMEQIIEPTAEQAAAVHAILERAGATNQRIIDSARNVLRIAVDSMRAELAPMLTVDQRDRLGRMSRLADPFRPPPRDRQRPPRDDGERDDPNRPPPRDDRPPPPRDVRRPPPS